MFESLHGEEKRSQPDAPAAKRDAKAVKIEQLLLSGLEHYFKGRYERAIDVWTRVLFLDRTHARARAYIERARAALAERLRESEEFLHTGVEAFNRGDVDKARVLLTSAVARGGGRDEALALLDRLDRLETAGGREAVARGVERGGRSGPGRRRSVGPVPPPRRVRPVPLVLLLGLVLASGYAALSWNRLAPTVMGSPTRQPTVPSVGSSDPLPLPSAAEITLVRAERLAEAGRHRDALALLVSIGTGDSLAADADVLRTAIQRELLASGPGDTLLGDAPAGPGER